MSFRCVGVILVCSASAALAAEPTIHLRKGVYAERSAPCKDAPLAAIKTWDGKGFGGAHSSACLVRVLHAAGSRFAIEDTCSALGDGTPAPPETETATVTVKNARSFRYARSTTDAAVYRWCGRN